MRCLDGNSSRCHVLVTTAEGYEENFEQILQLQESRVCAVDNVACMVQHSSNLSIVCDIFKGLFSKLDIERQISHNITVLESNKVGLRKCE